MYYTREQKQSDDTRELHHNWSQLPQARVSNAEWLLSPVNTRVDTWHQSQSSSEPQIDSRDSGVDRIGTQSLSEPREDWSLGSSSISRVWAELPQPRVTRGSSYRDGYFQYLNVPAHKVSI